MQQNQNCPLYYFTHSSSPSKPDTYITHNATQSLIHQWVCNSDKIDEVHLKESHVSVLLSAFIFNIWCFPTQESLEELGSPTCVSQSSSGEIVLIPPSVGVVLSEGSGTLGQLVALNITVRSSKQLFSVAVLHTWHFRQPATADTLFLLLWLTVIRREQPDRLTKTSRLFFVYFCRWPHCMCGLFWLNLTRMLALLCRSTNHNVLEELLPWDFYSWDYTFNWESSWILAVGDLKFPPNFGGKAPFEIAHSEVQTSVSFNTKWKHADCMWKWHGPFF